LLGIPTTAARAYPPVQVASNRWSYDFFAMDDFKVSPKLTLNLGVRYELHLNWKENNGLMSLFDIASGKLVIPDGAMSRVSPIFPKNFVGIAEASSVGFACQALIQPRQHSVDAADGLAYRPGGR